MSVISSPALFMGEDGYQISRSVRLRSSASAYFSRTNAVSPTSNKICTWSFWFKNSQQSSNAWIVGTGTAGTSTTEDDLVILSASQTLYCELGGTATGSFQTSQVFRDPSAWYHIVVAFDTTQATNTNRIKVYVNGVQVTSFASISYPAQNATLNFGSTQPQSIGRRQYSAGNYLDGYLAEVNFIDGQALTPSSFGQNDPITGVWGPKKYAGTYGNNGFYLNFSDNSAATAATIGKDYSGNGNNWTPNNISVTTGSTYDSMLDTPTPYADGGNGRGNYPTLNPLWYTTSGAGTLSNGNLTFTQSSGVVYGNTYSTMAFPSIGTTGKYYFELVFTNGLLSDVNQGGGVYNAANTSDYAIVQPKSGSTVFNRSGTTSSSATGYAFNDVLQVAVDTGAGKIWFGKNNTWYSGDPAAGTSPTYSDLASGASYVPGFTSYSNSVTGQVNFGQRPFAYTPPTGFKALNTQNLPDSTIKAGNKYFDVAIQTGNTTGRTVSGLAFQPDLVWVKNRAGSTNRRWGVIDSVRGVNKTLTTQYTDAEVTSQTDLLTAFNSDGFTIGADAGLYGWNGFAESYAHFVWKKGATPGFDIVTYTGNGAGTRSVAHSLGVAPKFIVIKDRSSGTAYWPIYHASIPTQYLTLNSTSAGTAGQWISADSSNFSFSSLSSWTNTNADNYVAYLFAEVAGFSKFGSYTGNGSADGPFVYCGFRPKFILRKWVDGANQWVIFDTSRDTYNQSIKSLYPNLSNAEETLYNFCDILSNGFKMRNTDNSVNGAGGTYIYAAFAENPFKYALAR